jgi:hypothetical protein
MVAMAWAQPAQANTKVVKGGETRLEVNLWNFVQLLGDGIFASAIPPARIEYGAWPAAIFPIRNVGLIDAKKTIATVPHDGGLRMEKQSIGVTIDTTNITLTCAPLAGCHLLATANKVLPNEVAEVRDFTISDNGAGTVTVTGRAVITGVTALALNTLFQTQVFFEGMELGVVRSTIQY